MNQQEPSEYLMTPSEVARYLKLNLDTVYRLIRESRLSATRIGRSYRLSREDLDEFLTANSTRPKVKQALFARVAEIGKRSPDLDGDELLVRLDQLDDRRSSHAASA